MAIPAEGCILDKYLGKEVPFEFALACGDVDPRTLNYLPIGALRGTDMSLEWDTVDATASDNTGSTRSNYATYKSFSVSGDGVCKTRDGANSNHTMLFKHVANPVGGQPIAWIRLTYPDITLYAFVIITTMGRATPFDELATFSFECSSTDSPFGVIVEDTPLI